MGGAAPVFAGPKAAARRHVRLVGIVEVEDGVGRRAEVLHYRVQTLRGPASGGVGFDEAEDVWCERSGRRLATTDGASFRSSGERFVRVAVGGPGA